MVARLEGKVVAVKDIVDNVTGDVVAPKGTEFLALGDEGLGQVWVEHGDVWLLQPDEYKRVAMSDEHIIEQLKLAVRFMGDTPDDPEGEGFGWDMPYYPDQYNVKEWNAGAVPVCSVWYEFVLSITDTLPERARAATLLPITDLLAESVAALDECNEWMRNTTLRQKERYDQFKAEEVD